MVRAADEILYRLQDSRISDADYSVFKVLFRKAYFFALLYLYRQKKFNFTKIIF